MLPGPWWPALWLLTLVALRAGAEGAESALSVPRCKSLKEMDVIKTSESDCYCYNQNYHMEWMYVWSTIQVKITSPGLLHIVYITGSHNCQYPETILSFIKCAIDNFWAPKESTEITLVFSPSGETVCFLVKPIKKVLLYTISVHRNIVDFKLFCVFVAGIFLFFYAKTLSQSPAFCYFSGMVLGVVMPLTFILLMVRRYIPKYSTFGALMIGCWFASVYVMCQLLEDLKWLWYGNRIYVIGYVLVAGLLSFAACYKHGPISEDGNKSVLMWVLRVLALVLVCTGVAVPQFACAVVMVLASSPALRYPLKALRYVRGKMKLWFTSEPLVVKYLTDEEYREQSEAETTSALEELRRACRQPDFPSWLAVSRLHAPKKFAEFVLGASHLSPEEISIHEEQYGLGGVFLEEQLFSLQTDTLPAS